MKNQNKGFIVSILIVIAALLTVGGGYLYEKNKPVNKINQVEENSVTSNANINSNENIEKTTSSSKVTVFGSDNSVKNGQVLTSQQEVVKQIVANATPIGTMMGSVKNCGNDFQCIIDAAKTCTQAKADVTTTIDVGKMFGALAPDPSKVPSVTQTQTSHYEIRGFTNGMCVYYSKLTDIKNPNLPSDAVQSLLSQAGDMTCSYSTSDLITRLINVQAGSFSGSFDSNETPAQRNARQCREFGASSESN